MVTEIIGLTAGFVGIRLAGQGALGLAAISVVAHRIALPVAVIIAALTARLPEPATRAAVSSPA